MVQDHEEGRPKVVCWGDENDAIVESVLQEVIRVKDPNCDGQRREGQPCPLARPQRLWKTSVELLSI